MRFFQYFMLSVSLLSAFLAFVLLGDKSTVYVILGCIAGFQVGRWINTVVYRIVYGEWI